MSRSCCARNASVTQPRFGAATATTATIAQLAIAPPMPLDPCAHTRGCRCCRRESRTSNTPAVPPHSRLLMHRDRAQAPRLPLSSSRLCLPCRPLLLRGSPPSQTLPDLSKPVAVGMGACPLALPSAAAGFRRLLHHSPHSRVPQLLLLPRAPRRCTVARPPTLIRATATTTASLARPLLRWPRSFPPPLLCATNVIRASQSCTASNATATWTAAAMRASTRPAPWPSTDRCRSIGGTRCSDRSKMHRSSPRSWKRQLRRTRTTSREAEAWAVPRAGRMIRPPWHPSPAPVPVWHPTVAPAAVVVCCPTRCPRVLPSLCRARRLPPARIAWRASSRHWVCMGWEVVDRACMAAAPEALRSRAVAVPCCLLPLPLACVDRSRSHRRYRHPAQAVGREGAPTPLLRTSRPHTPQLARCSVGRHSRPPLDRWRSDPSCRGHRAKTGLDRAALRALQRLRG